MILSQFEEAVWDRRGSDCDRAEAWHHGGEIVSAVEAALEFGEVAGYMLVADGAVSVSDGALDVAEGGVDPFEGRVQGGLATGSGDDRLVDAAGVADPSEAVQAVTDNGAGGLEIALRQGRDFGTAETLHAAQLQADWLALRCGFDRRHDRRLARRTAARLPPLRSPPRSASSISIRPVRRFVASRSIIACMSLCLIFHRRGCRADDRAPVDLAADVVADRRHASGGRDPQSRSRTGQGSRQRLRARDPRARAPLGAGPPPRGGRPVRGGAGRNRIARALLDLARRHPRDPARHHRPRPRAAMRADPRMNLELSASHPSFPRKWESSARDSSGCPPVQARGRLVWGLWCQVV